MYQCAQYPATYQVYASATNAGDSGATVTQVSTVSLFALTSENLSSSVTQTGGVPTLTAQPTTAASESTSTPTITSPAVKHNKKKAPIGGIVGGVVGGIAVIALVAILAVVLLKKKGKKGNNATGGGVVANSSQPEKPGVIASPVSSTAPFYGSGGKPMDTPSTMWSPPQSPAFSQQHQQFQGYAPPQDQNGQQASYFGAAAAPVHQYPMATELHSPTTSPTPTYTHMATPPSATAPPANVPHPHNGAVEMSSGVPMQ
jgi:hypothetical protein